MNNKLFDNYDLNVHEIITTYFNIMYSDGQFLETIYYLINKIGFSTDGAYCYFPDMNSYDENDHFKGIGFDIGYPPTEDDKIIVSEETFYYYVRLACEKYLKIHPEDTNKINKLLAKISG
ncbi:MAG: ribonuclease toxin immunity protein CdiI [Gilliamella sp.]|uniref:ribonuclease toxin immunity protein CdiI n=1 Tax=Gilliamella sp. TaxID=1891236 RepID=UPI0025DAD39B|nr:ribonuclease toxin immunity protein CdiI [Gilliamella sp.]MCO6540641.1 ribonuclease toxin immunity protein CdiI [Gilliamella sp.]